MKTKTYLQTIYEIIYFHPGVIVTVAAIVILLILFVFLYLKERQRVKNLLANPRYFLPTDLPNRLLVHTKKRIDFDEENFVIIGKAENPNLALKQHLINDMIHIKLSNTCPVVLEKVYEICEGSFMPLTH
jgi:hypothetical protein